MSTPFAATLQPPEHVEQEFRPLLVADVRFCLKHERIEPGSGEALDSPQAPFARFTSKAAYPLTGEGAVIVASSASDTGTITGQTPGHNGEPFYDDSHLDDR